MTEREGFCQMLPDYMVRLQTPPFMILLRAASVQLILLHVLSRSRQSEVAICSLASRIGGTYDLSPLPSAWQCALSSTPGWCRRQRKESHGMRRFSDRFSNPEAFIYISFISLAFCLASILLSVAPVLSKKESVQGWTLGKKRSQSTLVMISVGNR